MEAVCPTKAHIELHTGSAQFVRPSILHLLGLDHKRLTFRYSGRDFRLTDVHGNVMKEIIA